MSRTEQGYLYEERLAPGRGWRFLGRLLLILNALWLAVVLAGGFVMIPLAPLIVSPGLLYLFWNFELKRVRHRLTSDGLEIEYSQLGLLRRRFVPYERMIVLAADEGRKAMGEWAERYKVQLPPESSYIKFGGENFWLAHKRDGKRRALIFQPSKELRRLLKERVPTL